MPGIKSSPSPLVGGDANQFIIEAIHDLPAPMASDDEVPVSSPQDATSGGGDSATTSDIVQTDDPARYLDAADTSLSIFTVDFVYGASLRQLIEFLKRVAKELPLVFSKYGISTAVCSASRQITAHAVIRREDLTRFEVDETKANHPATPTDQEWYHVVNVDSSDLFEQISKVGKKDSIRLFQPLEQPGELRVLSCCSVKGSIRVQAGSVRLRPYTPVAYSIVENPRKLTTEPNVTIQLSRFCGAIAAFAKRRLERAQSIDKIEMALFDGAATLTGLVTGGSGPPTQAGVVTFGSRPSNLEAEPPSAKVLLSAHTLPALLKTTNIATEGVVRLYSSGPSLVRAEIPVGCYGTVRIYLSGALRGRGAAPREQPASVAK